MNLTDLMLKSDDVTALPLRPAGQAAQEPLPPLSSRTWVGDFPPANQGPQPVNQGAGSSGVTPADVFGGGLFNDEQAVLNADLLDDSSVTPLGEGLDDPYLLRAVFVVGAGGSGKSTVADEMFGGRGLKRINQDAHLERITLEKGRTLADVGASYGDFKDAQALARKERDQYADRRLGMVIDATGWEYRRVAEPMKRLRDDFGYDCYMVFVSTSLGTALQRNDDRANAGGRDVPQYAIRKAHTCVHANLLAYRKLFGKNNIVVVKNDADIDSMTWQSAVAPELYRVGSRLLDRPLKNPVGRAWVRKQLRGVKVETADRPTIVIPAGLFDSDLPRDRLSLQESVRVMWHGRTTKSATFDLHRVGSGNDQEGPGFYFSSSESDARTYAYPSGLILKCELRLTKELPRTGKVKSADLLKLLRAAPHLADSLTDWAESPAEAMRVVMAQLVERDPFDAFTQVWVDFYRQAPAEYLRQVVKLGYDHSFVQRTAAVQHAVVFDPSSIRVLEAQGFVPGGVE